MTVNELNTVSESRIKVLSGYDGRVMCRRFNPKKHTAIASKEILNLWADAELDKKGFTPYINQVISVYVHDDWDYIERMEKKKHEVQVCYGGYPD